MTQDTLSTLAKTKKWSDLEREWLAAIERPDADPAVLLPVIDLVVEGGKPELAETMAWAWLSAMKESHPPAEALRLGRGLLLRLPDGNELREEILSLYRQTHSDRPDLENWIDRSGLKSGKSVRRAMTYLTTALRLAPGVCLVHKTEDSAAEVVEIDLEADTATLRGNRRTTTLEIGRLVDDYEIADEHDFRVLSQLHSDRLAELLKSEPVKVAIGILRAHGNRMDRDAIKLLLVPRYLAAEEWSDWWAKIREGVKRSAHLRLEGRSPMFLIYDPAGGQTAEAEALAAFKEAAAPSQWLDVIDGYLRDCRQRGSPVDVGLLERFRQSLAEQMERYLRHKEPMAAFAAGLVLARIAEEGTGPAEEAGGYPVQMLRKSGDPAALVSGLDDARLWTLALRAVERAFPDTWPQLFARLILYAPAGQCDVLAKRVESAGRGDLLPPIVEQILADPGRHTDPLMWLWKKPAGETTLPIPPRRELLNMILGLVGPARASDGKAADQTINEMRAKVRAGLSARDYAGFREAIAGLDLPLAQTVRRQIERAEGLGPRVQEDMLNILRTHYPKLYVKARVEIWDDESVLYFTEAGLKLKEAELNEIVNVKMRENAKAIGEAAAHGDLSENSEYKFALEERDLLRARMAQLNMEISLARVLEPYQVPSDIVSIGQRITLRPTAGGEPLVIGIMGANDGDTARRVYSYKTPLARLMLGRRVGDVVNIALGDAPAADYTIEKIECAV